jgi:hypothetical protein
MKVTFLILLSFLLLGAYAQRNPNDSSKAIDTGQNKPQGKPQTNPKSQGANGKPNDQSESKPSAKTERSEETTISQPNDPFTNWSKLIAIIGLLTIMTWTIIQIFGYVKTSQVFIGHNTIKLIGFVLLLPSICIVSLVSPSVINGSVLAALLGTIAGYVLSRNQENDGDSNKNTGTNAANRGNIHNEVDALKKQLEDSKKENEELKTKLSSQ